MLENFFFKIRIRYNSISHAFTQQILMLITRLNNLEHFHVLQVEVRQCHAVELRLNPVVSQWGVAHGSRQGPDPFRRDCYLHYAPGIFLKSILEYWLVGIHWSSCTYTYLLLPVLKELLFYSHLNYTVYLLAYVYAYLTTSRGGNARHLGLSPIPDASSITLRWRRASKIGYMCFNIMYNDRMVDLNMGDDTTSQYVFHGLSWNYPYQSEKWKFRLPLTLGAQQSDLDPVLGCCTRTAVQEIPSIYNSQQRFAATWFSGINWQQWSHLIWNHYGSVRETGNTLRGKSKMCRSLVAVSKCETSCACITNLS